MEDDLIVIIWLVAVVAVFLRIHLEGFTIGISLTGKPVSSDSLTRTGWGFIKVIETKGPYYG